MSTTDPKKLFLDQWCLLSQYVLDGREPVSTQYVLLYKAKLDWGRKHVGSLVTLMDH